MDGSINTLVWTSMNKLVKLFSLARCYQSGGMMGTNLQNEAGNFLLSDHDHAYTAHAMADSINP